MAATATPPPAYPPLTEEAREAILVAFAGFDPRSR